VKGESDESHLDAQQTKGTAVTCTYGSATTGAEFEIDRLKDPRVPSSIRIAPKSPDISTAPLPTSRK
jgi:hypothetical protein